jgi:large subunit ribosomal protein L5
MSRLRALFKNKIFNELKNDLKVENNHLVPKLEKIVVNLGIGFAAKDDNLVQQIKQDIFLITGQMPIEIKAKQSISNFKVREGMICALRVTLRRTMMYEFLDRFIHIALPQSKNFFGFSDSIVHGKSINIGIKDMSIFPELPYREKILGLGINIVTTAKTSQQAKALLNKFNLPFKN